MVHVGLEQWICKENVDRYRTGFEDEADQAKRTQLQDLLSQELIKLHAMFPD